MATVGSTQACVTTFTLQSMTRWDRDGRTGSLVPEFDGPQLKVTSAPVSLTVDWSTVMLTAAGDRTVTIQTQDGDFLTLDFQTTDGARAAQDAKRLRFAAEFLRAACERKSQTGF